MRRSWSMEERRCSIRAVTEGRDGATLGPGPLPISPDRLDSRVTFFLGFVPAIQEGGWSVSRCWRTIVVDDNPTLLKVVARLLSSIPGVEVVGEANSGHGALEAVDRLRPDLVLMDLAMPGMDGLEATRRLVARPGAPAVIIMTVHDLPHYRDAALAAGARKFIAKSELGKQLGPAIGCLLPIWGAGDDETVL
jgi:CheY-like chemotaxis protein